MYKYTFSKKVCLEMTIENSFEEIASPIVPGPKAPISASALESSKLLAPTTVTSGIPQTISEINQSTLILEKVKEDQSRENEFRPKSLKHEAAIKDLKEFIGSIVSSKLEDLKSTLVSKS